jgi:hypothetical protein
VEERGVAQCKGPQREVHCSGPSSPGVQKLLACALREVTDGALGNAILEVGVYAAEGKLLACVVACLLEGIVREAPIVTVVVLDPNAMLGSEGLEGAFGSNGFNRRVIDLGVDVSQATVVVDKDGSAAIALFGEFAFELRNKP